MNRLGIALFAFALSAPLAAHEGLALDSAMHNILHTLGTDNVLGVGGIVLAMGGAVLWRRRLLARTARQAHVAH